ncbi:hypothetical protein CHUAL_009591 [Chamberlinius hualienensis]
MALKIGWKRFCVLFGYVAALLVLHWLNLLTITNVALTTLTTAVLIIVIADGFFERCYVTIRTLPRDLKTIRIFLKFRLTVNRFIRNNSNIPAEFQQQVQRNPDKVCLISDNGRQWTFREMDEFTNRLANAFHTAGYVRGDIVALFMESVPEFVCIWLGLAKIGVISALINHNLRMQPLIHTIITANSKGVIFGFSLGHVIEEILGSLPEGIGQYYYGEEGDGRFTWATSLMNSMAASSAVSPPPIKIIPNDRLLYIYTSGTTGLPKAAIISHLRCFFITAAVHSIMTPDDIIYEPLPVYHTAGGIMGVCQAVCFGTTVVIKKKFSASQYWSDCIRFKCTVTQYLGETCRYLLAQPPSPQDAAHSIRVIYGSGLKSQIWNSFVTRFNIPMVIEVYGSTEGNANIVNIDGKPGAVGFIPSLVSFLLPCAIIKVDEKTCQPIRNSNGLCIQCKPGEVGEFVGKIRDDHPERRFDGYVNEEATSKKIYKDVFVKGDKAFASGDILVMDRWGYLYFRDRTGDTFRWKGENVSTSEVETVISTIINLTDCVVYGVEIPNCDGRAGMAAILDPNSTVNLEYLAGELLKQLPVYARPLFIRTTDSLPMTGTFKLKKVELQSDGFDPIKIGHNSLFYLNGSKYEVLTPQVYEDICKGKIRY